MCVCLSVCLVRDALRDCPLPGPFSATSPVPPIRIPKPLRKPVTAAVLTLQNDFFCHLIITVRSHFPSKPKKQGKKIVFPHRSSHGVLGSSLLWLGRAGSLRLVLQMLEIMQVVVSLSSVLSAGVCWEENIWTKSAGICAIIGPVCPASSKGCC